MILTIGYGQGHSAAAAALEEEFSGRGWETRLIDPCEADRSGIYELTKMYYRLCVRRAPWLWGITYAQTDTSDWSSKMYWPGLRTVVNSLQDWIVSWKPDFVLCTYPVYGYMLDYLRRERDCYVPYGMVVTDAIEISKPWLHTDACAVYVPDEYSLKMVATRYRLNTSRLVLAGFPVRKTFLSMSECSTVPNRENIHIVYGVYLSVRETVRQIRMLLEQYTKARITLLAGDRVQRLRRQLKSYVNAGTLEICATCDDMAALFSSAHLYIGKTGAATLFESYAKGVPFIANFALPGQEQGNLELLLNDDCGMQTDSACQLVAAVDSLLANGADRWTKMRHNMLQHRSRVRGAEVIAEDVEQYLSK